MFQYTPPLPPQNTHKVWILDCNSCGTFLTNRGMKAVLLLRPNVPLFSTDALPANCSPYSHPSRPPSRPNTSPSPSPPRTCECLTQALSCHGCGATIGYMVVIPCPRCTSSITTTNRATNGHRFVFHSREIRGTERHYIAGEQGIRVAPATTSTTYAYIRSAAAAPYHAPPHTHAHALGFPLPPTHQHQYQNQYAQPTSSPSSTLASALPSPHAEYLPTPPLEQAELPPISPYMSDSVTFPFPVYAQPHPYPYPSSLSPPVSLPTQHPFQIQPPFQISLPSPLADPSSHRYQNGTGTHHHNNNDQDQSQEKRPSGLRHGDALYWHQLVRGGELGAVVDLRCRDRGGGFDR